MIFGLLALLIILFTSPLHAAEETLFVRDANLLKAKSLRCLFTRQVTTNWTSWETTWSKEVTIENMEYIFAAIPQKGSKARLIKRVPGEPSGIQEVFIIRTLEALNFLEVNPERPIHTTAVMVMRENREAGTFVATTSQHTITKDGAVVPTQSYGRCEVMAYIRGKFDRNKFTHITGKPMKKLAKGRYMVLNLTKSTIKFFNVR